MSKLMGTSATAEGGDDRTPEAPPAPPARVRNWSAAGAWGFVLGVGYAVLVRFYQAAGGQIGLAGKLREEHVASLQTVSYLTGLLILAGAAACPMLAYRPFRVFPRWVPRVGGTEAPRGLVTGVLIVPVLIGGTYSLAHWMTATVTKILDLTGVIRIEIPDVWVTRDRIAADWWEILFYEPWFFAMGLCLVLSALQYARDSGVPRRVIRTVGVVMLIVAVTMSTWGILVPVMGWELTYT